MRASLSSVAFLGSLVLSGCSAFTTVNTAGNSPGNPPGSSVAASIRGVVHGGQNPIKNAHVYLYAIGNTGYGGAAVSMLTKGAGQDSYGYYVLSGSDGSFNITGDSGTCPASGAYPVTYLMALGGDSGSGTNSAISLIAPTGVCTNPNFSSEYVVVNEVSTVATMYVAQGIITDLAHVSAPTTALAQTEVGNLYTDNLFIGGVAQATTPGGNGTAPQAEINTLANILAACVNSNGAVTGPTNPTPCYTLFNNAPTTGFSPTIPSDTATAALNIARNPGANVASLYSLQTAGAPFQPSLSSAPNDFTVAVVYKATPALNSPGGLAIDKSGNVWIANNGNNSLTEFGPDGSYTQTVTTGGLNGPWSIAIDGSGNLWVSNHGANSISEFNSSGTAITGSPFTSGGLTNPEGLAVDANNGGNHLWVANPSTNILSEFNVSNGSPVSSTGISTASLNSPRAIAVDDNGLVWITNAGGSGSVSLWDPGTSSPYTSSPYSGGGLSTPAGVAIDTNNLAWIANNGANVVSEFAAGSGALSASGYSGGGLGGANSVVVDSSNIKWVVNRTGNSISEFASNGNAISPSTGYLGSLSAPISIGIDLNGNVWVTNSGNNTITEFVGAATPLVTPVVCNLLTSCGYGDKAVNEP